MDAPIDLLAIAAHPDDAELFCGGTLRRAADQGYRTAILDLTAGEAGTRGSAAERQREAEEAARILGLAVRRNVGLPDAALVASAAARAVVARHIRELRPRVVILHPPGGGRHPDHRAASRLGRDACFLAGLRRAPVPGQPHRPHKILYALSFHEPPVRPRFVVDITEQMERKLEAIAAFASQFEGRSWAGDVFARGDRPLREQVLAHAAYWGSLIRRPYGEPFWTRETLRVDDVVALEVNSL